MLQAYIEMIEQSEFIGWYQQENDTINYDGEDIEVVKVIVPVDEFGNSVIHTFHAGTETLIDVNYSHKCTCK